MRMSCLRCRVPHVMCASSARGTYPYSRCPPPFLLIVQSFFCFHWNCQQGKSFVRFQCNSTAWMKKLQEKKPLMNQDERFIKTLSALQRLQLILFNSTLSNVSFIVTRFRKSTDYNSVLVQGKPSIIVFFFFSLNFTKHPHVLLFMHRSAPSWSARWADGVSLTPRKCNSSNNNNNNSDNKRNRG